MAATRTSEGKPLSALFGDARRLVMLARDFEKAGIFDASRGWSDVFKIYRMGLTTEDSNRFVFAGEFRGLAVDVLKECTRHLAEKPVQKKKVEMLAGRIAYKKLLNLVAARMLRGVEPIVGREGFDEIESL